MLKISQSIVEEMPTRTERFGDDLQPMLSKLRSLVDECDRFRLDSDLKNNIQQAAKYIAEAVNVCRSERKGF